MNGDASVSDVMRSDVHAGEVRLNLGDTATAEGYDTEIAQWGVDGFVSRPNDPDALGAAQALYLFEGAEKRVIGTRDNRWASKAGELAAGDRAIVTNAAARVFLKRATNSVSIYTESADGDPILFDVNGGKGNLTILAAGGAGNAVIQVAPGEIKLAISGGGAIVINDKGVHVFGAHFGCNTAGGNFGVIGAVAPPPGINSVLTGVSGPTAAPNSHWTMAP